MSLSTDPPPLPALPPYRAPPPEHRVEPWQESWDAVGFLSGWGWLRSRLAWSPAPILDPEGAWARVCERRGKWRRDWASAALLLALLPWPALYMVNASNRAWTMYRWTFLASFYFCCALLAYRVCASRFGVGVARRRFDRDPLLPELEQTPAWSQRVLALHAIAATRVRWFCATLGAPYTVALAIFAGYVGDFGSANGGCIQFGVPFPRPLLGVGAAAFAICAGHSFASGLYLETALGMGWPNRRQRFAAWSRSLLAEGGWALRFWAYPFAFALLGPFGLLIGAGLESAVAERRMGLARKVWMEAEQVAQSAP